MHDFIIYYVTFLVSLQQQSVVVVCASPLLYGLYIWKMSVISQLRNLFIGIPRIYNLSC